MARRDSLGGYEEERFKDKVDIQLQCSLCHKVLKDPVQCPNDEHYFCRSCIQNSLLESEACPVCEHHLTEKTLTKPPRILMGFLQNLEMHCDHENRGCQEFIKLEFLDQHVNSCGYSPTRCANVGCAEVMNRNEKEQHEREQCDFRKIVCDECGEQVIWKSRRVHPCSMRKEMDDLARTLNVVQNDVRKVEEKVERVELTQSEITKEAIERYDLFTGRQKIFVCGGYNGQAYHNSVESYSWPENSWRLESAAMREVRSDASAFVRGREIYVSGGWDGTKHTESNVRLNVDQQNPQWMTSDIKMPIKCRAHRMVHHQNSAILTGGLTDDRNVSSGIYTVSLNPYSYTRLLAQMPEPRCAHGCEIIDNQVIIAGGRPSVQVQDTKNTVYVYDLNNNQCKTLAPLPSPVADMATVSYKDNVILIGGVNEKGEILNSVVMYDVKTGKVKMLPCLNQKRAGCAAVITGNVIIVMGGYSHYNDYYKRNMPFNNVEFLDLSTNVWRQLPAMKYARSGLAAVLTPVL